MRKEEKLVCEFVYQFVNKNWDKIDKERCEIPVSKQEFLEVLKSDLQTAIWVVTEVADWGMDKEYLGEILVKLPLITTDFMVWRIAKKYIKVILRSRLDDDDVWEVSFIKPKT